jgi:hypothetical protein
MLSATSSASFFDAPTHANASGRKIAWHRFSLALAHNSAAQRRFASTSRVDVICATATRVGGVSRIAADIAEADNDDVKGKPLKLDNLALVISRFNMKQAERTGEI